MTSLICREFNCLPEEADRQSAARCFRIVRLRRYEEARDLLANADRDTKLPDSPMIENVVMAQFAIQKQAREEAMSGTV
jgi:hypothetical protein